MNVIARGDVAVEEITPFQLSRAYAGGWSTGRKCQADDEAELRVVADRLNPFDEPTARARWAEGFMAGASHDVTRSRGLGRK